jgi:hypothetical protein
MHLTTKLSPSFSPTISRLRIRAICTSYLGPDTLPSVIGFLVAWRAHVLTFQLEGSSRYRKSIT